MSYSRYSRDEDDYYDDARPRRRKSVGSSARTQEVPYSELQRIRRRELASMQQQSSDEYMAPVSRSRTMQDDQMYGSSRDSQSRRYRGRYADDDSYNYRRSRRRDSAPGWDDDGVGRRSRRRRGRDAEPNDQQQQRQQLQKAQNQQQRQQEGESQETEGEGTERNSLFDRGSDGFITAAAGAALGAITARHFAHPKDFSAAENTRQGQLKKNWKMIAGAVAGAAAFNMGEQAIKTYFEEQAEHISEGGEFVGEMIGGFAPDIL